MGVWIETLGFGLRDYFDMSHPVWVCGLKPEMDSIGMQQN